MTSRQSFFPQLASKPTFVLTGDQDWAPDWALESTLTLADERSTPFHLFVTNKSPLLAEVATTGLTLGIHPNFMDGSTHGGNEREVLDTCQAMVPEATTFRCHAFAENTYILRELVARSFTADSNLLAFLQPQLVPIVHGAGLLRFPVFLEDDVLLDWARGELDLGDVHRYLFTPGLKILNFHPSLVGLNVPNFDYYNERREAMFGSGPNGRALKPYGGRGIATVLGEIIDAVRDAGFEFVPFPALVSRAYNEVPGELYTWPERAGR
jgi:hypothetical protein